MEFFRKYQRPILFTAVLFALVTFSITGDMLSFVEGLFRDPIPTDSIVVDGRRIHVDDDDKRNARAIHYRMQQDVVSVTPRTLTYDPEDDLQRLITTLRRHAVEVGIDASYAEVDRAIGSAASRFDMEPRDLTGRFSSFDAYRAAVYESMRLGTYVRVQALAALPFDYQFAERALEDKERVKVKFAVLDKEKIEEQLGAELDADSNRTQVVREWLDGLDVDEKRRYGFLAPNKVQLEIVALQVQDFAPEQFEVELDGFEISDDDVTTFYKANLEQLFKLDEPDEETGDKFKELEDVRADIERRLRAAEVVRKVWKGVQDALYAELEPLIDIRSAEFAARNAAQTAQSEAKIAAEADPENEELAAALEAAEQAFEAAKAAHEAAEKVVSDRRAAFDVAAKIEELVAGRGGFTVMMSGEAPVPVADLNDLPDIGEWLAVDQRTLPGMEAGQLSTAINWTESHAFMYRVAERLENPEKDYSEIEDEVRAKYLASRADEVAEERQEKFEEALDRLGRETRATQIAEIEAKRDDEVESKLSEWREDLEKRIEEADQLLANTRSQRARHRYETLLVDLRGQLAEEEARRTEITDSVNGEIELEIEDEIAKAHADVVEAAAEESGFEVAEAGPQLRTPTRRGSVAHLPKVDQFLFYGRRLEGLEVGESTGVLEDPTNRAVFLGIVTEVAPAEVADLKRRDLLEARRVHRIAHVTEAVAQSFSFEALKKRLDYVAAGDEMIEPAR